MPTTLSRGIRIHWEEEGSGPPLLMIMGLGLSLTMWRGLRSQLARHFRVILLDNCGSGRSGTAVRTNSIDGMARDAAAVMDAAGIPSAHVFGISMGGMIAQELTLIFPHRVQRLILACTNCGGTHSIQARAEVLHALGPLSFLSRERHLAAVLRLVHDPSTPPEIVQADADAIRHDPPRLAGYLSQIWAISHWSSWDRLPAIRTPVLIIHGENDRLIPAENAHILASRIAGSRVVILPRAGHVFPSEQPERTLAEILNFLRAQPD